MPQIAAIILGLLNLLTFALIGRALLSWFDPGMRWPISQLLVTVTEPLVAPIRRVVPSVGMIDLSFMVTLLLLYVLRQLLTNAFYG